MIYICSSNLPQQPRNYNEIYFKLLISFYIDAVQDAIRSINFQLPTKQPCPIPYKLTSDHVIHTRIIQANMFKDPKWLKLKLCIELMFSSIHSVMEFPTHPNPIYDILFPFFSTTIHLWHINRGPPWPYLFRLVFPLLWPAMKTMNRSTPWSSNKNFPTKLLVGNWAEKKHPLSTKIKMKWKLPNI